MIVYINGEKPRQQASFILSVCPARHLEGKGEMPADWVDDKNEPIEFNIEFVYGKAEVPDKVGLYLVKHEMAMTSRLIRPLQQMLAPGRD
jgi:hypothetical protein